MAVPDPSLVILSASIDFPAQVAMTGGPIPLTARLALEDATGQATQFVQVEFTAPQQPEEFDVVVSAEGFEEKTGDASRLIRVYPDRPSQPAVFLLVPQSPGARRIAVDFYHRDRLVGSTALQCEVQAEPSSQVDTSLRAETEPVTLQIQREQTSSVDLELRVTLSHDRHQLSYLLHSSDPDIGYRWQPAGSITLPAEPAAWVDKMVGELEIRTHSQSTKGGSENGLGRFHAMGDQLGEALLSPELRREFRRIGDLQSKGRMRTLLVTSDEPWIPWELVKPYPDDDFLCMRYRLGRWLAGQGLPGLLHAKRVVLAASASNGLPALSTEIDYFRGLAQRLDLDVNVIEERALLMNALEAGRLELLHLAGHAAFDQEQPEQSQFQLRDDVIRPEQISGRAAQGLARSRPLVFMNASSSGRTGMAATGLAGWAERFVRAGASAFIGAQWDVSDELAAQFAVHLYDQLWAGEPLGEAVFRARAHLRERAPDNPTWLAYALWGDPNLRVELPDQGGAGDGQASRQGTGDGRTSKKGTGDGRPPAKGTGDGGAITSGTGDGLPFIPGTAGASTSAVEPPPALPNDVRIWFVSANPDEGTDWDKLFAQGDPVHWTKVRNPTGQRNIALTRAGDLALAYSSAGRQEVVGLARIAQDPDEQSDGRWAVWIEPLVHLERGMSLDELRRATPDLVHIHNPMSSFSPVTFGQWDAIRGRLAERNPAQQGQLPQTPKDVLPALSWSPPLFSGELAPGERTTVQYALSNSGNVPFRRGEPLTIAAQWRLADQPPDREPSGRQDWTETVALDLEPGESLPVAVLSVQLPDTAGSYTVEWQVHADFWGSDMAPATTGSLVKVESPLPPARYGLALDGIDLAPPEAEPGQSVQMTVQLRNSGDVGWEPEDMLTVTLGWTDAAGQALTPAPEPRETRLGSTVPPSETMELVLDNIAAPQQEGDYILEVTIGCDSWDVSAAGKIDLAVRLPTPDFAATLTLDLRPPEAIWPGERFEIAGRAGNSGAQPWAERQVQIDALVTGSDPVATERLRGAPQWLPAIVPGDAAAFRLGGAAPLAPAPYTLTLVVSKVDLGRPPVELVRSEAALAVRDLAELNLAELTSQAPADLPAAIQARRLDELGGRLVDPAVEAAQRNSIVQEHLLPGLWSSEAQVSRAALDALFVLREEDEALDQTVRAALAERDGNLGALPGLLSSTAPVDDSLAWLDRLLPRPAPAPPDEAGRQTVVMPVTVLATPTLAPPDREHTAVVTIEASKVTQRNGEAVVEPGRITLRYGARTFVSRNPMDDAQWKTGLNRAELTSPRAYGEFLFDTIFNTDRLEADDSTYNGYIIASNAAGHRLRMEIVVAPEVGSYKWEYLRNARDRVRGEPAPPLAVYRDSPFVRRGGSTRDVGAAPARPLGVLVAICNPAFLSQDGNGAAGGGLDYVRNLTRLDVDAEVRAIEPALQRLRDELGIARYRIMGGPGDDPVTFDRLIQALKDGWHVLHIVGHGVMEDNRYFLVMDPDPRAGLPVDLVAPERFETPQFNDLRLVVLSSCQSAQRERLAQQVLPSLAERLLGRGVPAVIAMQGLIKIEADQLFAQRFYEDLARTGMIDMAVASARYDLYHYKPERWDWGMPVLYMSTHDGALFEVDPDLAARAARERSQRGDLEKLIKPAAQLLSDPELADRVVNNALQGYARALGVDAQQVSRLATALASQLGGAAPRSAPLARQQERQDWPVDPVRIDGHELAKFVQEDPDNPMDIPDRVFHQAAAALNAGKHVVLTGAPGTGKTTLAEAICRFVQPRSNGAVRGYRLATATADWTTFDTVGGFVPQENGTLQFRPGILLEAIREGHWIIIDEINRAEIDKSFGELFTVLSGQQVTLAHTVDGQAVRILPPARSGRWDQDAVQGSYDYVVHPSWRIVGTMNVYDKSYLFNMSFAFMRRFAFVDVDLPDPLTYQNRSSIWLKEIGLASAPVGQSDSPGRTEVMTALRALLDPNTQLMKRRAIGPAIVKDMVRYLRNRWRAGDEEQPAVVLSYLAEAFQLYAAPQLDSLDEPGILSIYGEIGAVFKPLLDSPHVEHGPLHRLTMQRIRQMYPHIPEEEWLRHFGEPLTEPPPGI